MQSWKKKNLETAALLAWFLIIILWSRDSMAGGSVSPLPVAKNVPPTVTLSLTRFGFEPEEIFIKVGKFYLSVANYTGQSDLNFVLAQDKTRLSTVPLPFGKFKSRNLLDLVPGKYLLQEETRPKWQCLLIVEKQP